MKLQERLVKRALRHTDPDLYLEERWSHLGFPFYAVMCYIGPETEPFMPVDWRSGHTPLPLSLNVVDQLRRQEGDVRETIKAATAANIARKKATRAERMAKQEDIIQEYHKWDKRGFVKVPDGITGSKI